jgi:hypothetical protein
MRSAGVAALDRHLGLPHREVVQQDQRHIFAEDLIELFQGVDLDLARKIGRSGPYRA